MEDKKPEEEHPVPTTMKEFKELCDKVGFRKALQIAGIELPNDWSKPSPPPPPAN